MTAPWMIFLKRIMAEIYIKDINEWLSPWTHWEIRKSHHEYCPLVAMKKKAGSTHFALLCVFQILKLFMSNLCIVCGCKKTSDVTSVAYSLIYLCVQDAAGCGVWRWLWSRILKFLLLLPVCSSSPKVAHGTVMSLILIQRCFISIEICKKKKTKKLKLELYLLFQLHKMKIIC